MSPPPDKDRPWLWIYCRWCEFETQAEWAGLRHEDETGHLMDWPGGQFRRFPSSSAVQSPKEGNA